MSITSQLFESSINSKFIPMAGTRSPFLLSFLYPTSLTSYIPTIRLKRQKLQHTSDKTDAERWQPHQLENIIMGALVRATDCSKVNGNSKHGYSSPLYTYHKGRRRPFFNAHEPIRHYHQVTSVRRKPQQNTLTKEECLQMVDYYRDWYSTQARPLLPEPPLPPPPYIPRLDGPRPAISPGSNLDYGLPPPPPTPVEPSEAARVRRVLNNPNCTHWEAFKAYTTLPYPGVAYLGTNFQNMLFTRLAAIDTRSQASMINYLSVMDDMKNAELYITQGQWNTAMAFAGRCFGFTRAAELNSAMDIWRDHGSDASMNNRDRSVSLSVLFDLAAKAGKFALAEMIFEEIQSRQLPIDRHARVGLIFFEGLKRDGQGVRNAYKDFVASGEIVDTVVLNCVIASLLRAGEPDAAQQVYERMKRLHTQHADLPRLPFLDWQATRSLTAALRRATLIHKDRPEKLKELQTQQSLVPNLRTFNIFLDYYIGEKASLTAVAALLDEMRALGVPMHGKVFVKLFRGFANHGGVRYTFWTKTRLESVWTALMGILEGQEQEGRRKDNEARRVELEEYGWVVKHDKDSEKAPEAAPPRDPDQSTTPPSNYPSEDDEDDDDDDETLDPPPPSYTSHPNPLSHPHPPSSPSQDPSSSPQPQPNIHLSKWLIIWALRAFAKCNGQKRMHEIWEVLESRWRPESEREDEAVRGVLARLSEREGEGGRERRRRKEEW